MAAFTRVFSHVFWIGLIATFRKRGYQTSPIKFFFFFKDDI